MSKLSGKQKMLSASTLNQDLEGVSPPVRERVVLFRLLVLAGPMLRARLDRRLAPAGLTSRQGALLTLIRGAETPPMQRELAEALGVSHQNVRQLARALVRKGFIEIRSDPADRRARRFAVTTAGKTAFRRRNAADFDALAGWFSALQDLEVRTLVKLLGRLIASLEHGTCYPPT